MRIYSDRSPRESPADHSQYDGHPPDVVAWIALGMLKMKYSPLNREDFSIKTYKGLDAVISVSTDIELDNKKKIVLQVQAVSTPYRDRAKIGVPPILPLGNLSRTQRAMGLTLIEYAQKVDPSFPSNPDFYSVCEPTHFPNPSVRQLRTSLSQLEEQPTGSLGDIKPVGFLTSNGLHILYVPINVEHQRGRVLTGGEIFDSRNSPLPHFLPKVLNISEEQIRKTSHDAKFHPVGIRFSRRDTKMNYCFNFDITVATIGDDELLLKVLEPLSQHGWNITSIEISQNPITADQKINVRALKPKNSPDTSKELVSQLTDIRIPIKTSSESGVWLRPYDFDIHLNDQPGMLLELYKAIHQLGGSISRVKYVTGEDDLNAHKVTMWLPDMESAEESRAQLLRFIDSLTSKHDCCSILPTTFTALSYRKFGSVTHTKDEVFIVEKSGKSP